MTVSISHYKEGDRMPLVPRINTLDQQRTQAFLEEQMGRTALDTTSGASSQKEAWS